MTDNISILRLYSKFRAASVKNRRQVDRSSKNAGCHRLGATVISILVSLGLASASHAQTAQQAQNEVEDCPGEEISPNAGQKRDQPVYKYQANILTRKFHCPNCPYAMIMGSDKKVYIEHRYEALAQGFKPCRFCLPPVWRTVRGRLLKQDISR